MMNSRIIDAAVVRLAAVLMDRKDVPGYFQYACTGAQQRYATLQTACIQPAEGIDDLPAKASAFGFGQRCGRFLRMHGVEATLDQQAAVLAGMLFRSEKPAIDPGQLQRTLLTLLYRAQLTVHTTKPGYEDIHAWLRDYNELRGHLDEDLLALAERAAALAGTPEALAVFNRQDPIIAMALRGEALGDRDPREVGGDSLIARVLIALCRRVDFSAPLHLPPYTRHPDFPEARSVDGDALEAICRGRVLDLSGMKDPLTIESIEMRLCGRQCLMIVRTRQGLEGIAIAGANWQYFYPILEKKLAPWFIGKDCRDVETLFEEIYVRDLNYKIQGLAYWCCVSWLEAAILDILGKARGVPIGRLFGPPAHDYVDYYCASGNRGTTPQEELEILSERISQVGAKAIKFKIGGRMSWNQDSMGGRSDEIIVLARKYFGDDMVIHADANGSFDPAKAIEYGHMLQDIHAYFYEEPCRFDYLWETRQVAEALEIPIAFGEQETSLRRFRYLIEHRAVGVVQPDVQYFGGFIRTAKVARMAQLAGILVTPHISGGIQYANVLHLASFTPNMGHYQELKVGYEETRDFFTTPLVLRDGRIHVPQGTGLCMAFDPAFLAKGQTIFLVDGRKHYA